MKRGLFLSTAVLSIVFLSVFIYADTDSNSSNMLARAVDSLQCKTDFTLNVISSLNAISQSSSLSDISSKLQVDMTQIQSYADSKDQDSLKSYIKSTYDIDLQSAKDSVTEWRKANSKNLTLSQKTQLAKTYMQLLNNYRSCLLDSLGKYGQARVTAFNAILDGYQKRVDKLTENGMDTSSLNQTLQDARTQIVEPLQEALAAATDAQVKHDALKEYCLFDGCKNGTNFHLAAKFEIAKLEIALSRIENNSNASQFSDKTAQLGTDINNANTTLDSVGAAAYTNETRAQVWDNIKLANAIVKEIASKLKGE